MVDRLGERIGFLHLRSVQRESGDARGGTFHEAAHLEGDAGMTAVIAAVHRLQQREDRSIPMRPDHGHQMLDDLSRVTNPGYSLPGRPAMILRSSRRRASSSMPARRRSARSIRSLA
jgi:mannonate dehydratase